MDNLVIVTSTQGGESIEQDSYSSDWRARQKKIKRLLDVSCSVGLLVLFSPLILGVSLLLLAVQGRPILFKHRRIGRNGEAFDCLKFRTMVNHADRVLNDYLTTNPSVRREWELKRKLKNDPRVTSLGRVMRKASLDELPQLLNVLRGEMSLVGPRPIVSSEMRFYGAHLYVYQSVRPGITGPWQVGGRSNVAFHKRVELDVEYIMNWTLTKDVMIIMKTVAVVIYMSGSF